MQVSDEDRRRAVFVRAAAFVLSRSRSDRDTCRQSRAVICLQFSKTARGRKLGAGNVSRHGANSSLPWGTGFREGLSWGAEPTEPVVQFAQKATDLGGGACVDSSVDNPVRAHETRNRTQTRSGLRSEGQSDASLSSLMMLRCLGNASEFGFLFRFCLSLHLLGWVRGQFPSNRVRFCLR